MKVYQVSEAQLDGYISLMEQKRTILLELMRRKPNRLTALQLARLEVELDEVRTIKKESSNAADQ